MFKSNGTAEGTVPIAMPAGSAKLGNFPGTLVSFGGALYFDYGNELMKTTGGNAKVVSTLAQPRSNPKLTGNVNNLTAAGDLLYFTFPDAAAQGEDLYASNGTARGTTVLKDFIGASPYSKGGETLPAVQLHSGGLQAVFRGQSSPPKDRACGLAMGHPRVPRS